MTFHSFFLLHLPQIPPQVSPAGHVNENPEAVQNHLKFHKHFSQRQPKGKNKKAQIYY